MRLRSILLLPALVALAACERGGGITPPPQTGGSYAAVLQSPSSDEGAALLELAGTGIEEVTASGMFLASTPIEGGRRVVIVRSTPGRLEFRVRMAQGASAPTARVVEVAGGDDQLRSSLTGYSVAFTRVEAE